MKKSFLLSTVLTSPFIGNMSAYANNLTGLIPDLYTALDTVSRELVGFIPAVSRNSLAERVALNELVKWPVVPDMVPAPIVPSMVLPTAPDQIIGSDTMTISRSESVKFSWNGDEQATLNNGSGYLTVQGLQMLKGMRALCNTVETDVYNVARAGASRAHGTAGTLPFQTNLGDSAQLRKILDDNGAPLAGRTMVINTEVGAQLRTLAQLTKANEAGDTMQARQGALMDLHGFTIAESGMIVPIVNGTAAGATTNAVGYAVGATVITLASAGAGSINAGDVVTFAGDANKYVVKFGDTDVSGGGTVTINAPGLRVAIPAVASAITLVNDFTPSIGFNADAIQLMTRLPMVPAEGDAAVDRMTVTDPRSGLSFDVAIYAGNKMVTYEIGIAWGVKVVKSEHVAMLLG